MKWESQWLQNSGINILYFSGESATGSMSIVTFGFAYPVEVCEINFEITADTFIPSKFGLFCKSNK